jgi:hypothetical protein
MPIRVQVPGHGIVEFPDGTPQDEMAKALSSLSAPASAPPPPERSWLQTAGEVGKGLVKGAAGTVAGLGELAVNAGAIHGVQPTMFQPSGRHPAFTRAEELTRAENTPQMVGKGIETVAEIAVPVTRAVQAIPSAARAGKAFQSVMGAAKDIPVDVNAPGAVGLKIMQLAERGGTMPRPVSQFLQWVTNPDKPAMTYEVARDFASNISRLSANEMQRLTPVMAREVAELRVVLNKSVAEAAGKAGKGREYASAMNEYAKAMKLRGMIDDVVTGAKRAAPWAAAAGAGTWMTSKMLNLLGKD